MFYVIEIRDCHSPLRRCIDLLTTKCLTASDFGMNKDFESDEIKADFVATKFPQRNRSERTNNICLFPSKIWYFLKMQKLRKGKDQKSLLLQTIILKGCFKHYISSFCNVLLQLELCLWGKVFLQTSFYVATFQFFRTITYLNTGLLVLTKNHSKIYCYAL